MQVHSKVGNAVRKQLPASLNPKILEQLEASFGPPAGRAASPPVPAVAKRMSESATPKQAAAGPSRRSNASPAPAVPKFAGELGRLCGDYVKIGPGAFKCHEQSATIFLGTAVFRVATLPIMMLGGLGCL